MGTSRKATQKKGNRTDEVDSVDQISMEGSDATPEDQNTPATNKEKIADSEDKDVVQVKATESSRLDSLEIGSENKTGEKQREADDDSGSKTETNKRKGRKRKNHEEKTNLLNDKELGEKVGNGCKENIVNSNEIIGIQLVSDTQQETKKATEVEGKVYVEGETEKRGSTKEDKDGFKSKTEDIEEIIISSGESQTLESDVHEDSKKTEDIESNVESNKFDIKPIEKTRAEIVIIDSDPEDVDNNDRKNPSSQTLQNRVERNECTHIQTSKHSGKSSDQLAEEASFDNDTDLQNKSIKVQTKVSVPKLSPASNSVVPNLEEISSTHTDEKGNLDTGTCMLTVNTDEVKDKSEAASTNKDHYVSKERVIDETKDTDCVVHEEEQNKSCEAGNVSNDGVITSREQETNPDDDDVYEVVDLTGDDWKNDFEDNVTAKMKKPIKISFGKSKEKIMKEKKNREESKKKKTLETEPDNNENIHEISSSPEWLSTEDGDNCPKQKRRSDYMSKRLLPEHKATEEKDQQPGKQEMGKMGKTTSKEVEEREEVKRQAMGFVCETDSESDLDSSEPDSPTGSILYDEYVELTSDDDDNVGGAAGRGKTRREGRGRDQTRQKDDGDKSDGEWLDSRGDRLVDGEENKEGIMEENTVRDTENKSTSDSTELKLFDTCITSGEPAPPGTEEVIIPRSPEKERKALEEYLLTKSLNKETSVRSNDLGSITVHSEVAPSTSSESSRRNSEDINIEEIYADKGPKACDKDQLKTASLTFSAKDNEENKREKLDNKTKSPVRDKEQEEFHKTFFTFSRKSAKSYEKITETLKKTPKPRVSDEKLSNSSGTEPSISSSHYSHTRHHGRNYRMKSLDDTSDQSQNVQSSVVEMVHNADSLRNRPNYVKNVKEKRWQCGPGYNNPTSSNLFPSKQVGNFMSVYQKSSNVDQSPLSTNFSAPFTPSDLIQSALPADISSLKASISAVTGLDIDTSSSGNVTNVNNPLGAPATADASNRAANSVSESLPELIHKLDHVKKLMEEVNKDETSRQTPNTEKPYSRAQDRAQQRRDYDRRYGSEVVHDPRHRVWRDEDYAYRYEEPYRNEHPSYHGRGPPPHYDRYHDDPYGYPPRYPEDRRDWRDPSYRDPGNEEWRGRRQMDYDRYYRDRYFDGPHPPPADRYSAEYDHPPPLRHRPSHHPPHGPPLPPRDHLASDPYCNRDQDAYFHRSLYHDNPEVGYHDYPYLRGNYPSSEPYPKDSDSHTLVYQQSRLNPSAGLAQSQPQTVNTSIKQTPRSTREELIKKLMQESQKFKKTIKTTVLSRSGKVLARTDGETKFDRPSVPSSVGNETETEQPVFSTAVWQSGSQD